MALTLDAIVLQHRDPAAGFDFYSGYSAVVRAPDGTVVKVSAHSKKNTDFAIGPGQCRLGLMPHQGLAKDSGAPELASPPPPAAPAASC
jgi:hypothetical protein